MKTTRENVAKHAEKKGLEPVQIDGIPEGFSYKEPDVRIGGNVHRGRYLAFPPLHEFGNSLFYVIAFNQEDLLTRFKERTK